MISPASSLVAPALLCAVSALAAVACSSGGAASGPACNPCTDGGGGGAVTIMGHDTNPDGLPYPAPTNGYGHLARSGTKPGNVIANLSFRGYINGDPSKGLQVLSLADYYDPCGKRLKLLHLSVAGVWCDHCNAETAALVAANSTLDADGVVTLQALSDGPVEGVGATVSDLNYWVGRYSVNFTEVLDPGPTEFAGFFNAAAIPWNADVDPRTMELLSSSLGWGGDVMAAVQPGLNAVAAPPLYTIPAGACSDQ
jgi:hypothetical protein